MRRRVAGWRVLGKEKRKKVGKVKKESGRMEGLGKEKKGKKVVKVRKEGGRIEGLGIGKVKKARN